MEQIPKTGIFTSHPIQYQAPFFKYMNESGKIHPIIYFQKKAGVDKPVYDPEFGKEIKWDIPLLAGYESYFLTESPSLYYIFKKNQFDEVIIYGWNSILNFKVIFFAKLFKVKVLLRAESPLNQELLKGNNPKQILENYFSRFYSNSSIDFYISEQKIESFMNIMGSRKISSYLFHMP